MLSEFEDLLLKRLERKGIMDDLRVVGPSDLVVLKVPRGGSGRLVKKALRMRRKGVGRIKMEVWRIGLRGRAGSREKFIC